MFRRGGPLRDQGHWVGLPEAASLLSRITGSRVTPETLRRWCREQSADVAELHVWHIGDRYYIDLTSILDRYQEKAEKTLAAVKEERSALKKGWPSGS